MPFASVARAGILVAMGALSVACSSDVGDGADSPAASAGSASGGASAGSSTAGNSSSSSGSASQAGNGGNAGASAMTGGNATGGNATGGSATGGSASGGVGGAAVDPNGGAPGGPASSRHTPRPIGSKADNTAGYWEYLPPHYGNGARYPLLVFRHGIGENGNGTSELTKVVVNGPPKLIEADQWPESRNWIVLSVQHTGDGCATSQETVDFFKFALTNYDVDPTRVYLTGLSCGAIGSWNYLGDHTDETVAAAVLICGDGRSAFTKAGCNLGKVPIWAFHGEADTTVDPKGSTETVASLQACTNPPAVDVKLTTYPGVGHDSWTMTYALSNPQNDIYTWLASHHK
ncbi:MAG: PHB depolymerase family esterase [Myxococcales bacterium]